jgi:hypothetical protein
MALSDEFRKKKEENKSTELLKLADGESVTYRVDTDENGKVIGKLFKRNYKGKESDAIMFPVTILPSGERRNFPLSFMWAEEVFAIAEEDGLPTMTVTRKGEGTDTKYRFRGVQQPQQ